MKTRSYRKIWMPILIAGTILLTLWLLFPVVTEEPLFAGKTMNQWLVEMGNSGEQRYAAAAAIGPALVPSVSRASLRPESWWSRNYDQLWRKLPARMQSRVPRRIVAPLSLWESRDLLRFYGPAATNALPILIAGLAHSDHRVRTNAITALGELGETAEPARPAIEAAMKLDARLISSALVALNRIQPKPKPVYRPLSEVSLSVRPPRPVQNNGSRTDAITPYGIRPETYQDRLAPVSTESLDIGNMTLDLKPGSAQTIYFTTPPVRPPVKKPGN